MIDQMDLELAQGKFDNEEDEASYQRFLDSIRVEDIWTERELEKMRLEWEGV